MNRVVYTEESSDAAVRLKWQELILKHQSLAHDKLRRRANDLKQQDITEAGNWCKENEERGWLLFILVSFRGVI